MKLDFCLTWQMKIKWFYSYAGKETGRVLIKPNPDKPLNFEPKTVAINKWEGGDVNINGIVDGLWWGILVH